MDEILTEETSPETIAAMLSVRERGVLFSYTANLMLQQDNNLYQAELGLLDEQTLSASKIVIEDYWAVWAAFDVTPTPRVERTYADLQRVLPE